MAIVTRTYPITRQQSVMRVPSGGATVGGWSYAKGAYGSAKLTTGPVGLTTGGALIRDLIYPELTWDPDIHQIEKAEIVWRSFLLQFGSYGGSPRVRAALLAARFNSVGGVKDEYSGNAADQFASQPGIITAVTPVTGPVYPRSIKTRLALDVTRLIEEVAPATVLRRNGTAGGARTFHGFRIYAADEADAASRWEYDGIRAPAGLVPYLRLTFRDTAPPNAPTIDALGPATVAGDPTIVASGGGGRLEVDYLFSARAGDTNALTELEVYGDAATDATPGARIKTTGAIAPTARAALNAFRVVITALPTRTTMRYRLRTQSQLGTWGAWTPLANGRFRTAYQPQTPLDPLLTSDPLEPHAFLSLNSPNDPGDFITGFTGQFVRYNPDGTSTNLWPTLSRIDVGGTTTRTDIPWGGVQLVDGDRVSWRGALYNRDGVLSPFTSERTVTMRTRVGPDITPPDTGTKLTSRSGPITISDAVEFDAIRYLLFRGDAQFYDSGPLLAGPDTSVVVNLPAGLIGWGETIGIQAQTRATGTSVFGTLSNRSAFYINSLPTTTLTASDGDDFTGPVLPTRDVLWSAPYTDVDATRFNEVPQGKELELRAGATPQGSGALIARRSNVSTILADERTGRRLDALTSTSGWTVDADVTATTAATQPTGYSGNSASIQATGGSSTGRGARSTVSTADLDLGTFGDGTLIRIWRRITSNTNLTRWSARFEFATTSDWAEYDLAVTGDAVDTWVERTFAKAAPARTNGTVDWSLWSGKVFYRVVVSGAYTGDLHVRDLRIGAIATAKDTPDGGVTWESSVDARVRYRDNATAKLATTLAASSTASATNVKLTSVTGLTVGDELTIVTAGFTETRTISTVGTAGAGGTGVTVSEAYTFAHSSADVAAAYVWGSWSPWVTRRASEPPTVAIVRPGGGWAEDAFGRTASDTWGSADAGGAWTTNGTAADYDVAGGKGTITVAANTTRIGALLGQSILDTDALVTFRTDKVPTSAPINVSVLMRASAASDTSYYRGRVRINTDASMTIIVEGIDSSTEVAASSVTADGLTFTHSTDYRLRAQAIGTSPTKVRARVWPADEDEPTDWPVSLVNSTAGLQDAGAPGVRVSCGAIGNAPILFSLDDFRAAAVVIDPTADMVHSYSSPSSKAQAASQPILYRRVSGQDQLVRDALVTGAGTTSTLPELTLDHDAVYAWEAVAYDSDGLPGISSRLPFVTWFQTPTALPAVRGSADAVRSSVSLDWARTALIGASTSGGPSSPSTVEAYEAAVEHAPLDIVSWFLSFGAAFPTSGAQWCLDRGSLPMIAWEPWDGDNPDAAWQNVDITAGTHDADIDLFADGAAAWGGRVLVRLMHEMNGGWVPWGIGASSNNGNTPATFVAAWRYVVERCRARGATNIEWVWCVNVDDGGPTLYRPLADIYPGDDVVDWTAMDGYNFGSLDYNGWEEATTIFGETYDTLVELAPSKPVMIAEVGCAPTNGLGDRPTWIETMKADLLDRCPMLRAVVWFEFNDTGLGIDWRLASSALSLAEWVDLIDAWTDPLGIVDPFLDHFRVYRLDPVSGQEVRIDGGPERAADGRPKLTLPAFVDFDARLGTNQYRVTAHNGAQESDGANVAVMLVAARPGSWMLVGAGQDRYTFPINPTSLPRTTSGTVETFRVPGNPYPAHLHWGGSGRTATVAFAYLPAEDGPLALLIGELFATGTPLRIKAPEGYAWQDIDARVVSTGPETPRPGGWMDLQFTADEIDPDAEP